MPNAASQGADVASASADHAQTIDRSPQAKRGTPRRSRSSGSPIQREAIKPPLDPDASTKAVSPPQDPDTSTNAVSPPPRWLVALKTWLMTGNLVAKLGLVILFIGIAFLLKYVAATITIPIELRLAALVLADMGLLAGTGNRHRHPDAGDLQHIPALRLDTSGIRICLAGVAHGIHVSPCHFAGGTQGRITDAANSSEPEDEQHAKQGVTTCGNGLSA
jgi:uncharacterized membrane protein